MPSPESIFFIDTSFHISYKFSSESNHQKAQSVIKKIKDNFSHPTFITTNLIFSETINLIMCRETTKRKERYKYAIELGQDIMKFNSIGVIDPEMVRNAWILFQTKATKGYGWSFVDCASFIFIREIKKHKHNPRFTIKNVLAFDRHFIEAQQEFKFKVCC